MSALSRLSLVHANRLDFTASLGYGLRATEIAESLGDERAEATAMDAVKQVALETGDVETLERLADRLIEMHRRTDDLWLLQFPVLELGYANIAMARLDRAFAHLEEALAINRRIDDRGNEPMLLSMLGMAHRARGDYAPALALGRRALELARELDHAEWIAWSALWLAGTELELGLLDDARALLDVGIAAGERAAADLHLVRLLGMGAWVRWRLDDPLDAAEVADRAEAILDRVRVAAPRAYVVGWDAYVGVARVRAGQGRFEAATSLLAPVVAACEACGWSDGIVEGRLALGEIASLRGDVAAAAGAARRALAEALRTDRPVAWQARAALADALRAAGEDEEAEEQRRLAEAAVAGLMTSIDDATIRETVLRRSDGAVVRDEEGPMTIANLHHVSIRVQDPDRSRRFYETVLGLSFMELPVGEATTRIWRGSPSEGTMLATQAGDTFVILAPPLEGTPAEDRFDEHRIGVDHLAFGVDDRQTLDELVDRLAAAGVDTAGVETDPVLNKEYVCFRDPDNVQWEFYSR